MNAVHSMPVGVGLEEIVTGATSTTADTLDLGGGGGGRVVAEQSGYRCTGIGVAGGLRVRGVLYTGVWG